ncbi:MAG: hypothetical protein ACR2OZ_10765 [Verrucomicrobiales bacterium]
MKPLALLLVTAFAALAADPPKVRVIADLPSIAAKNRAACDKLLGAGKAEGRHYRGWDVGGWHVTGRFDIVDRCQHFCVEVPEKLQARGDLAAFCAAWGFRCTNIADPTTAITTADAGEWKVKGSRAVGPGYCLLNFWLPQNLSAQPYPSVAIEQAQQSAIRAAQPRGRLGLSRSELEGIWGKGFTEGVSATIPPANDAATHEIFDYKMLAQYVDGKLAGVIVRKRDGGQLGDEEVAALLPQLGGGTWSEEPGTFTNYIRDDRKAFAIWQRFENTFFVGTMDFVHGFNALTRAKVKKL